MTIPEDGDGVHQNAPTAALGLSYGNWKALHTGGKTLSCTPSSFQDVIIVMEEVFVRLYSITFLFDIITQ